MNEKILDHREAITYFDSYFEGLKSSVERIVSERFKKSGVGMTCGELHDIIADAITIVLAPVKWSEENEDAHQKAMDDIIRAANERTIEQLKRDRAYATRKE